MTDRFFIVLLASEHSPSFALGMETSRPMSGASFAPSASLDNADTNF